MELHLRRILLFILCLIAANGSLTVRAAESVRSDHVTISWLAPDTFGRDEGETLLGLHFAVDPGWHVYWRNAGDSGAAPKFHFSSDQLQLGDVQWPFPSRLPIAHLTNLGYEGSTAYLLPVRVTNPAAAAVTLTADLEWLVCKEDCIPGFATLALERPLASNERWDPGQRERLNAIVQRIPRPANDAPFELKNASFDPASHSFFIQVTSAEPVELYPLDAEFLPAAAPQRAGTGESTQLRFAVMPGASPPATTAFVAVKQGSAWEFKDIEVNVQTPQPPAPAGLAGLILLAVLGGIVLNLMPCVFPVLSIKVFSLAHNTGNAARLREGLLYSAGVLTTFALLGGVFLGLRGAGAAVGWGFQLQSPFVVLALILLFWFMALSFLGVFEFGHRIMNLAGAGGSRSAFMTGVLAVFVAAPCTGPFMGAALGASATLPPAAAMAIFVGLGAGLALPFLLLAAVPRLGQHLPRPGAWMASLRQLLAFPLFASALWLLWVLDRLIGDDAWLTVSTLLLLLTFAMWLGRSGRRSVQLFAAALAIAGVIAVAPRLGTSSVHATPADAWQPFDAAMLEDARQQGRAVFVDFTAAWCITCQVNKKLVLDTEASDQLFRQHDVVRMRADWTRYDPEITRALAALGRNSVPVYVFYPAGGGDLQTLPQILTQDMIQTLFQ